MALAKSAEDRYATAADMADDLEDVLAGRSASHALLAGPTSAARDPRGLPPPDLLDAFLEELPLLESASNPGARAAAPAAQTVPARVSTPVTTGSGRRWLLPATAVVVLAVLAAVANRAPAPPAATTSTTMAQVAPTTTAPTAAPVTAADRPAEGPGGGHRNAGPRIADDDGIQCGCRGGRDVNGGGREEPYPAERRASVRERPADRLDRRRARLRDEAPGPGFQEGRRASRSARAAPNSCSTSNRAGTRCGSR